MRDKHYSKSSYRIDTPTKEQIKALQISTGLSFNQLFLLLIKTYEEQKNGIQ